MKKTIVLISLFFVFVIASSFRQDEGERGFFTAYVDGHLFPVQEDQLFRGLLVNKAPSSDGKVPARTVVNAIFNGPSHNITDEKIFTENVQFEIGFEDGRLGTPGHFAIALQSEAGKYYLLKEKSKLSITQFAWESDKKHFRISAEFDCAMRSWEYPKDGGKDVTLKGTMSNVRITVPSWLSKN